MSVHSIKIKNVLSFKEIEIKDMNDMNCIVGKNNTGKSNLLKVLKYFYNKLEEKEELPPKLNSNYSYSGTVSVTFNTERILAIARKNTGNKYLSFVARKLMPRKSRFIYLMSPNNKFSALFTLTLNIYSDGSTRWSIKDRQTRNLILYLYPFFHIEPRHMDLHQWDSLWDLISRLKSFNLSKIDNDAIVKFFDGAINSGGERSYKKYIDDLNNTISTRPSSQKDKILSYIKAGLPGYNFEIDDKDLKYQSDGTNSFHFINTFLKILITISRREYIVPFVFIDEPELGLHPKMNEILINKVYGYYKYEIGVYKKEIRPKVFIATHSANIVKEVIKKFRDKQSVFCFKKIKNLDTEIKLLNSRYDSDSFINRFSDNEARLFFSDFILFVEGETELEIFGNMMLSKHFPHLDSIDVIKSSDNSVGEKVNPSYSNSAIPYLFLFDADKAISIEGVNGNYNFKYNSNGNYFDLSDESLLSSYNKYRFGYSKSYTEMKMVIKLIIANNRKGIKINRTTQKFEPQEIFEKTFSALQKYLLQKNIYLNRTTIEGCLINKNSAPIFFSWLDEDRQKDTLTLFNNLKSRVCLGEDILIDYMRVIFNGKTDTLCTYKNFNPNGNLVVIRRGGSPSKGTEKTSLRAKSIINKLEMMVANNRNINKTDGWVTKFLNYSILYIEKDIATSKKSFGSVFKFYFPELYDIIRMLQPDSRGEV